MALPIATTPTYNMVVPSSGASVRFRPFLVKEEKALLIAQQSEDVTVMIDTLKNVIRSCVIDKINADELATFDIEYIFTQIRSKSVGETVDLLFPCDMDHGEDDEKARVKITIDLSKLEVESKPEHNKKIELFGDVGIVMKYPTMEIMRKFEGTDTNNIESIFDIVADSIDYVYDNEELHYAKDQKKEELVQFLNNLTSEQFNKVQLFFATMPRIKKEVEYDCPVCGLHHKKTLEGMQSFF